MPQFISLIRRRSRRGVRNTRSGSVVLRALALGLCIAVLAGLIVIAMLVAQVSADLPDVSKLDAHFGAIGREQFEPVRFYDRSGGIVLFEARNPRASEARWLYVQEHGPIDLREHTLQALLAAVDPIYFTRPTPSVSRMAMDFLGLSVQRTTPVQANPILLALVEAQLIPLTPARLPDHLEQARTHLLAQELDRQYSRSRIMEWFINSADFGRDAIGLDAAALVYMGKHASELNLAESALLAPVILQPTLNPFDAPEESRQRQARLLDAMLELDWITKEERDSAEKDQVLIVDPGENRRTPLQEILVRWLQQRLGPRSAIRSGLTVFTTIDAELQAQAECLMETQLKRLAGGVGQESVPTSDGSSCLAAGLLPPLRPRDQGIDHHIEQAAFVVLDHRSGEIMALAGDVDLPIPAEDSLSPFIYLAAFSQGYSPGSMVLDIPQQETTGQSEPGLQPATEARGPVRIRTALANVYPYAAERMLSVVGVDAVLRITGNLGIYLEDPSVENLDPRTPWQVSLLDLSAAYGVLAYQGQRVGTTTGGSLAVQDLQPEILFEVVDGGQRLVYRYAPESRALVSPQLSYLFNNVLKDEAARRERYGAGNPLEIGRPAAVIGGMSGDGQYALTVGYTPSLAAGVWMGNSDEIPLQNVNVANSAGAVWHALMQYAVRDQAAQDWTAPSGVNTIEVCDPSGLLPTEYCPQVVREVFINGTEPITFDNIFQPFRVNKETGKLATLYTPLDQIEERIYLVPPPEAIAWAKAAGLEQPPNEYDTLIGNPAGLPGVVILWPEPFDFVHGEISISGQAEIEDFSNYRLQYGEGLNPTRWVQIGTEVRTAVSSGRLALWDTSDLDGLYTLQLVVVDGQGQLFSTAVNLTIDNLAPQIELVLPHADQSIDLSSQAAVVFQIDATDNYGVARAVFYLDGARLAEVTAPPYSTRWRRPTPGAHRFYVEVTDLAGNVATSPGIEFSINQ